MEKCLDHGMDDCIAKPFTPEDLYKILSHYTLKDKKKPLNNTVETKDLFDLTYLKAVSNNNEEFIKEMIVTFLETLPVSILEIRGFANRREWENLARATHKIKPSITLMGLQQAKVLAADIETKAKIKNPDIILIQLVQDFCASLEASVESLRKSQI